MFKFEISAETMLDLKARLIIAADNIKAEEDNEPIIEDKQMEFAPPLNHHKDEDDDKPMPYVDKLISIDNIAPTFEKPVTNSTDVDSRGMSYNARIHASSRNFNKDGSWRNKRGLDDAFLSKVETELMANKVQAINAMFVPPPPTTTVVVEEHPMAKPIINQTENTPVITEIVHAPKYEEIPMPGSNRPAHTLATFKNNLTVLMAQLINEGKIDTDYVDQLKKYFGVKEIWNVLGSEKQCLELYDTFSKCGFITAVD